MKGARDTHRRLRRERPVELGDEPALSVDRRLGPGGHRGISARWLAGTVLTGFASTALMGGALYASLDRQMRFATTAETVTADLGDGPVTVAPKGDRLARVQAAAHMQIVRLDTTTRVGEKEFVKVRPFARITTGLALARAEISPDPPAFNAAKIYAASEFDDEPTGSATNRPIEGEVSLVLSDLDASASDLEAVADLPSEEVARAVREAAEIGGQVRTTAVMPIAQASLFDFSGFTAGKALAFGPRDLDAFADLAIQGRAENVLNVSKSEEEVEVARKQSALGPDDRIVDFRSGDTLDAILVANGSSKEEAAAISAVMQERFSSEQLKPGLKVRLGISPGEDDRTRLRPVRVSIYDGDDHRASVALSESGQGYVAIDDPADLIAEAPEPEEVEEDTNTVGKLTLYASLFETAQKNQIPQKVFDTLVKVYSYDVDLHRKVKAGDHMEIFYALDESNVGEIFYTALTIDGETRRYYRYQSPEDGSLGFFDEKGKSARKFLMKKPIIGASRTSSGYGMRRHPILGYAKMHTGLDYSAKKGTPIIAAGNGTIEKAGWESGYGKYIRLQHANGYETAYAHMNDYAPGMKPGKKVRQGQVIGYVGTTGRSTGNHLHFEVLINGRFVNPASLKVPRGQELQGNQLLAFMHERERIDWAMKRAPGSTQVAGATGAQDSSQ